MPTEFTNEPFTDFSKPEEKAAYEAALKKIEGELGQTWPSHIGGQEIGDRPHLVSTNPSKPSQVIGNFMKATAEDADRAVKAAAATFETWKNVAPEARAEVLFNAAKLLRERKHEFSAIMTYECGKNWAEADGDTAEAIDFLEFSGREALRYGADQPVTLDHQPFVNAARGVTEHDILAPRPVGEIARAEQIAAGDLQLGGGVLGDEHRRLPQ